MKAINKESTLSQENGVSPIGERWPPPEGIHVITEHNNTRERVIEILRAMVESLPDQKKPFEEIIENLVE